MESKKKAPQGREETSPPRSKIISDVVRAHNEADRDIANDPEWSATSPNDDLDEGETARLGEDISGII
jgi:hypothetical protein